MKWFICVFFSVSFLGIYLWLFSSNRCSSETSVRIRQLWKYLWAEKCKVGSNIKQWHGPHPPEVSRLLLNDEWTLKTGGGIEKILAFLTALTIISTEYFYMTFVGDFYFCFWIIPVFSQQIHSLGKKIICYVKWASLRL